MQWAVFPPKWLRSREGDMVEGPGGVGGDSGGQIQANCFVCVDEVLKE